MQNRNDCGDTLTKEPFFIVTSQKKDSEEQILTITTLINSCTQKLCFKNAGTTRLLECNSPTHHVLNIKVTEQYRTSFQ